MFSCLIQKKKEKNTLYCFDLQRPLMDLLIGSE